MTSFPVKTEGFPSPFPLCPAGECYLTEWTIWSRCQISCVNGNDLGFGSVQVRSRAVLAQDPENLLQCPEQELEARPCTGQPWHIAGRGKAYELWFQHVLCLPSRGGMFRVQVEDGTVERFFSECVV